MPVSGSNTQAAGDSLSDKLSGKSPILGLKLYVLIGVIGVCLIALSLVVLICLLSNRRSRKRRRVLAKSGSGLIPLVSKDVVEIKASDRGRNCSVVGGILKSEEEEGKGFGTVVVVKEGEIESADKKGSTESSASGGSRGSASSSAALLSPEVQDIGWGRWYSLNELDTATDGFACDNVIGEGGYGIVYRGILADGSVVAIKKLLNNK